MNIINDLNTLHKSEGVLGQEIKSHVMIVGHSAAGHISSLSTGNQHLLLLAVPVVTVIVCMVALYFVFGRSPHLNEEIDKIKGEMRCQE